MNIVYILNVLILILSITKARDLESYFLDEKDDPSSLDKQHDARGVNIFNESPEVYSSYNIDWPIFNYLKKPPVPIRDINQHVLHHHQFVPEIVHKTESVPHLKLPTFDLPNILPYYELTHSYRPHYGPEIDTLHGIETLSQKEFPHVVNTFNNWNNPSSVPKSDHSLEYSGNQPSRWNPYDKYGNDQKYFNNYGHVVISNRMPVNMDVKTNSKSNLYSHERLLDKNSEFPYHGLIPYSNYYHTWSPFDLMHK